MRCLRIIILIFSISNMLCGIVFIALGSCSVITTIKENEPVVLVDACILIALGILMILISPFGCCGVILHNSCMLITFTVILIVVGVIGMLLGIGVIISVHYDTEMEDKEKKELNIYGIVVLVFCFIELMVGICACWLATSELDSNSYED